MQDLWRLYRERQRRRYGGREPGAEPVGRALIGRSRCGRGPRTRSPRPAHNHTEGSPIWLHVQVEDKKWKEWLPGQDSNLRPGD